MKAGDDQEGIGLNKEKECGGKSLRARPAEGLKDIAKARSLIRDWRIGQIPPQTLRQLAIKTTVYAKLTV
jgi:hypothetical protein